MDYQPEHTTGNSPKTSINSMAIFSLVAGIMACITFYYPPLQLFLGASAVILAYISKNGRGFSGLSIAGIATGVFSIISSILIFSLVVYSFSIMKDPANADMIRDIYRQYQEIFKQFGYSIS
ncbi:MAG: DUF4190 domain-containing protein [Lachnospiraceae bacterium]